MPRLLRLELCNGLGIFPAGNPPTYWVDLSRIALATATRPYDSEWQEYSYDYFSAVTACANEIDGWLTLFGKNFRSLTI